MAYLKLIFVLNSLLACAQCFYDVPVVIWGSGRKIELPSVSALHTVSVDEFKQDYVQPMLHEKSALVVFLQDFLSTEDFSLYGNAYGQEKGKNSFPYLQKVFSNEPALFLQSVDSPAKVLESLPVSIKLEDENFSLSGYKMAFGEDERVVIVVKLPSTKGDKYRQDVLTTNDEIIGRVMMEVAGRFGHYRAIYTGSQPSWLQSGQERSNRVTRAVGDAPADNTTAHRVGDCVLFATSGISVQGKLGDTSLDNVVVTINDFNGTCGTGDVNEVIVQFTSADTNFKDMTMTISLLKRNGFWLLDTVKANVTAGGKDYHIPELKPKEPSYGIWAPLRFCYSCYTLELSGTDKNDANSAMSITFAAFQMEGHMTNNDKFGEASDCVGFFTLPIWMGIFSVLLLVAILLVGIYAVMSIKTMDRFDDPRGKVLTITTND